VGRADILKAHLEFGRVIATNSSPRLYEVAAVLASLDASTRDQVLACFSADEREQLSALLPSVEIPGPDQTNALIIELLHALRWKCRESHPSDSGGMDLEQGTCQAPSPLAWNSSDDRRSSVCLPDSPDLPDPIEQFLGSISADDLVDLLEPQHPQLVAATLTLLHPDQAQAVLQRVSDALQLELAERMDHCEQLHPDIAMELRCELMNRLTAANATASRATGGSERRRYEN
jgi:flagellar motor switch protein FliG